MKTAIGQITVEDNLATKMDELQEAVIDIVKKAQELIPMPSYDLSNTYPLLFKSDIGD